MRFSRPLLTVLSLAVCFTFFETLVSATETVQLIQKNKADTWVATDGLGREIAAGKHSAIRPEKFVGIFYFVWQGAHGHDRNDGVGPNGGIMPKKDSDTSSPYNITEMLKANPENPQYGPLGAFHYWGEPYFGYYLSDDEWVIRKHAQMLSDAGVDAIFIDITNAVVYVPQIQKICEIYKQMRREGNSTPAISFVLNSGAEETINNLYNQIYKPNPESELWFRWQGKPLVLCNPDAIKGEAKEYFTAKQSWAWTKGQKWFKDGKDKWAWLDHSPQTPGWHESPGKPEQISVAIAQHPISNIGRSHKNGKQPSPDKFQTEKGIYFQEQWDHAIKVDPQLVFVTGWNEWIAMRFNDGSAGGMLGKPIKKGDDYFVDLYNAEYSRDADLAKDDSVKDHYYYQLVKNIRNFKGTRQQEAFAPVKDDLLQWDTWKNVAAIYQDDTGDTIHRKHPGWGRIKEYVNTSGRNDIIEARVASNDKQIGFYAKTREKIQGIGEPNGLELLLTGRDGEQTWEGFRHLVRIGEKSHGYLSVYSNDSATSQPWKITGSCPMLLRDNEVVFVIEKSQLGLPQGAEVSVDFKWQDNIEAGKDPMHWYDKGDTAPNGRFRYRYQTQGN